MLIKDLIKQLNTLDGNKYIVVQTNYPSNIAVSPNSPITDVIEGLDWDSDKVFISTEHSLEYSPSERKRYYESEIKRNVEDVELNRENIRVRQIETKKTSILKDLEERNISNISLKQLREIEAILNQTR